MNKQRSADPQIVHNIATGYMGTCALLAALELELFEVLSGKSLTSQDLAKTLGFAPKPVERLAVALVAVGLLERDADQYSCSPETERYLVRSSPSYFGDYYRFQVRHCLMPDLLRLDELIRDDHAMMGDSWAGFMNDPEQARTFILGQHSASHGGGRMLTTKFDFSPYRKLVDLGGGSGACAIAACQKHPKLEAVVVDFPQVLKVAEEVIAREGLADRITTRAGDMMKDDWPEGDVILISLIIHSYPTEDQLRLYRTCFDALPSGGAIVIHDFLLNDDYTGPRLSALYNLTSVDGVPMSGRDTARMLAEAGFVEPDIAEVIPEYTAMVAAKKP